MRDELEQRKSAWRDDDGRRADQPRSLDDLVPERMKKPVINRTINFMEVTSLIFFISVFVYMVVRYLFGI